MEDRIDFVDLADENTRKSIRKEVKTKLGVLRAQIDDDEKTGRLDTTDGGTVIIDPFDWKDASPDARNWTSILYLDRAFKDFDNPAEGIKALMNLLGLQYGRWTDAYTQRIQEFQRDQGLLRPDGSADGIIGPQTIRRLDRLSGGKSKFKEFIDPALRGKYPQLVAGTVPTGTPTGTPPVAPTVETEQLKNYKIAMLAVIQEVKGGKTDASDPEGTYTNLEQHSDEQGRETVKAKKTDGEYVFYNLDSGSWETQGDIDARLAEMQRIAEERRKQLDELQSKIDIGDSAQLNYPGTEFEGTPLTYDPGEKAWKREDGKFLNTTTGLFEDTAERQTRIGAERDAQLQHLQDLIALGDPAQLDPTTAGEILHPDGTKLEYDDTLKVFKAIDGANKDSYLCLDPGPQYGTFETTAERQTRLDAIKKAKEQELAATEVKAKLTGLLDKDYLAHTGKDGNAYGSFTFGNLQAAIDNVWTSTGMFGRSPATPESIEIKDQLREIKNFFDTRLSQENRDFLTNKKISDIAELIKKSQIEQIFRTASTTRGSLPFGIGEAGKTYQKGDGTDSDSFIVIQFDGDSDNVEKIIYTAAGNMLSCTLEECVVFPIGTKLKLADGYTLYIDNRTGTDGKQVLEYYPTDERPENGRIYIDGTWKDYE